MIGSFRLTQIGEFQPTRIGVFRPTQFGEFHPTRTAKSQSCQKWYKRLKGTICFLAILVAPISLLEWGYYRYILSIFGVIIAALNFMLSLNKYHENWIQYRMTCELLRHERYLYLTRAGEYGQSDAPFQNLVMRCESIISSENIDWAQLHRNEPSLPSASHSSTGS